MKRKNTEGSVGTLVATALFITIMFLMVGAFLIVLLHGGFRFFALGKSLFSRLLGWVIFLLGTGLIVRSTSASLWLWGSEIVSAIKHPGEGRWKRPLTALVLFGLIASGPLWLNIHLDSEELESLMLLYALYLFFAGLITIVPCALIYSLGKALAEKEMEKEEMDEAKKY